MIAETRGMERYLQFGRVFLGMLSCMSAKHGLNNLTLSEEHTTEGPRLRVTGPDGTYDETDDYSTTYEHP